MWVRVRLYAKFSLAQECHKKDGDFIVRSTYHLQKEILTLDKGECSRIWQHSSLWKHIGQMNTLNVVKLFIYDRDNLPIHISFYYYFHPPIHLSSSS
jgi:hypothetical protein